jgi:phospholipid/cholesterol/gamma-HCH transport system substrate-binding protein
MMDRARVIQLRAGLFVLVTILVLALSIFVLGKKSALFVRTDQLFVTFREVNGLVVGAPVRLAGLEIGSVVAISFPEDLRDRRARVRLVVRREYMPRIRADSRAFIDSNGLLGDKLINISLGDPAFPPLRDGSSVKTGEAIDFESLTTTLHDALEAMTSGHVKDDVGRIASALANVLEEVESGNGSLHQLIYEPRHARELAMTLEQARMLLGQTTQAMTRVDHVLAEVEGGDGGLHKLVYGPVAASAAGEIATAAQEIAAVAREVREGNGLAHGLIYDASATNLVAELEQVATGLNRMVSEIERGRGTLGGLIKDPTVYEDLKTVLGNVRRNVLFKALIRATIEQDDLRKVDHAPTVRPLAGSTPARNP